MNGDLQNLTRKKYVRKIDNREWHLSKAENHIEQVIRHLTEAGQKTDSPHFEDLLRTRLAITDMKKREQERLLRKKGII